METWIAVASGLFGVIVGVAGKYVTDIKLGRAARIYDEKTRVAFQFLEAVGAYFQAANRDAAARVLLRAAKSEDRQQRQANVDCSYQEMQTAARAADMAEAVLIFVVPDVAESADEYIKSVLRYAWHEIEYLDVIQAREAVSADLRRALGV